MTLIGELARLTNRTERSTGARSLARRSGATHLCIFLRDPDLGKFLPGPGFPQRLPGGMEWADFLLVIARAGKAEAQMLSPYSGARVRACGLLIDDNAIVVFFGDGVNAEGTEQLRESLGIIAALLMQEVRTNLAQMQAMLAEKAVLESRQLAAALSNAHDMLAQALHSREALLAEMRTKDERLQLVRQISGIGTWEIRRGANGGKNGAGSCEVEFSAETTGIFGMPVERFRGTREEVLSRIHPEDRQRVRDRMDAAMAGLENRAGNGSAVSSGQPSPAHGDYNVQFRVVWPNGVVRWVEDRGTVLRDGEGSGPVMIGFSLDITQRVMTEETLIRSEKLAAAGRLAASIAHEINNPLESLVNIIYLAKDDTDLVRIHELLTIADEELQRISSVARQALGFYRDVNRPIEFDIVAAIQQVIELFGKQVRDSGVLLKPDILVGEAHVLGWPGEIKQAVSNLLINAVHASSPGAPVCVRVKLAGYAIQIAVADSGHGIHREHLIHIFEPFFSTKENSGTGLGLWVTKQIIEKHGGRIRVRSTTVRERQGTVFLVTLPLDGLGKVVESTPQHLKYLSL